MRGKDEVRGSLFSYVDLALDDLEAWLADQPDIARRNWTVSAIKGFCAALVVGPERIATDAWLPVIFGASLPTDPAPWNVPALK